MGGKGLWPFFQNREKQGFNSENQHRSIYRQGKPNEPVNSHIPWNKSLAANIEQLKNIFHYPTSQDLIVRQIYVPSIQSRCAVISLSGMADSKRIEEMVMRPLLGVTLPQGAGRKPPLDSLSQHILPMHHLQYIGSLDEGVRALLQGMTLVLVENQNQALCLETVSYEHRDVEKTQNENVLKGPHESFVESLEVNHSLLRKGLKDERLVAEELGLGERGLVRVMLMYIEGITNPGLVDEVRRRIKNINSGHYINLPILEEQIEESSYSLLPSVLYTERPDRAISYLQEGYVVLLMDGSAAALIAPATFWSFFHAAEDQYQRLPYGNFIRMLRLVAMFMALLTPAVYVAVTNYHVEMLPTDLLMAIAAARERVPFPGIIEVLLMEFSFELIREAGIRIPTPIGPTIGIVGALILGQAAVQANIVSPILVIVVALTGLASFIIPDLSLNFTIRIMRFFFLAVALTIGFLGIAIGLVVMIGYACSIKSFGVPFFAPYAPTYKSSVDTVVRQPVWKQWLRPTFVFPVDPIAIPDKDVALQRQKKEKRG